jgi:hypothetical protein
MKGIIYIALEKKSFFFFKSENFFNKFVYSKIFKNSLFYLINMPCWFNIFVPYKVMCINKIEILKGF